MTDAITIIQLIASVLVGAAATLWIVIQIMGKIQGDAPSRMIKDIKDITKSVYRIELDLKANFIELQQKLENNRQEVGHIAGIVESERATLKRVEVAIRRDIDDLRERVVKLETRVDMLDKTVNKMEKRGAE